MRKRSEKNWKVLITTFAKLLHTGKAIKKNFKLLSKIKNQNQQNKCYRQLIPHEKRMKIT